MGRPGPGRLADFHPLSRFGVPAPKEKVGVSRVFTPEAGESRPFLLEYLRRDGRIGYVQATGINGEGKYYSIEKVRGRKRSLERLVGLFREHAGGKKVRLAVMHGAAQDEAKQLLKEMTALPGIKIEEAVFGQIGPGMVVHTGPGLVGVAFYEI